MDHAGKAYDAALAKFAKNNMVTHTILISEGTGKPTTVSRDALIKDLLPEVNKLFGFDADVQEKNT